MVISALCFFFFKQKTAYEMRISDWSSDVCSSDLVREDPTNVNLLYIGTELGVFVSWDRGRSWASLRNNLPAVSVRDIRIHPREHDLIVATHGRGEIGRAAGRERVCQDE